MNVFLTAAYKASLAHIEDFVFGCSQDLRLLEAFIQEHDAAIEFIAQNSNTLAVYPATGGQSSLFSDGRYRIFFKTSRAGKHRTHYLTHIIDNRQANLDLSPDN